MKTEHEFPQEEIDLISDSAQAIDLTDELLDEIAGGAPPATCKWVSCNQ